jgi:ribokinase
MNPDLVHDVNEIPDHGDDVRSTAWQLTWGGKAANAAVALAEWGVDTRLVGLVIGTDPLGDALIDALTRPRLDRAFIERDSSERTRHCVILVTPDGDRTIVCAGYEDARWQHVTDAAWEGVDVVLLDGFGGAGAYGVAGAACDRSIPTVWLDAPDPLPTPVDVVVWSSHEHDIDSATALGGSNTAVVLTAGGEPIRAFWRNDTFNIAPPRITPVDSTGAGDVFAAGCAYGLGNGWDPRRIVTWASAAGAAAVALPRTGVPDRSEIDRLSS